MIKHVRAYPCHLMLGEVDKVNKAGNLAVVRLLSPQSLPYLDIIFFLDDDAGGGDDPQ